MKKNPIIPLISVPLGERFVFTAFPNQMEFLRIQPESVAMPNSARNGQRLPVLHLGLSTIEWFDQDAWTRIISVSPQSMVVEPRVRHLHIEISQDFIGHTDNYRMRLRKIIKEHEDQGWELAAAMNPWNLIFKQPKVEED